MHSVLLAGYCNAERRRDQACKWRSHETARFFFFAFFRQAKASAKRARSGHTRTTGSLTRERGRLAAAHICYASASIFPEIRTISKFPSFPLYNAFWSLLGCGNQYHGIKPGGGTPHMKWMGMLVVSLRDINFGFWSHLGCSGQNTIIFSREGLV